MIHPQWRRNEEAYWAQREELLRRHRAQWVGYADGEVIVTMTQTHSQRIEPDMVPFQERFGLEGGLTAGTYQLRINDYSMSFEIP